METLLDPTRPFSRRSEDSGLGAMSISNSIGSSRGSSPIDLKLDMSSMSCSTTSLSSSTSGGGLSPTKESNPNSSLKNNANKNDRQTSTFQRSKSLYNPGGLKKKPLSHLKKSRTLSNAETNANSNGDSNGEVLLPKYKQMKCITMEVRRSTFGRNGWIVKPVDETLDLKQLQLNGALEKLINDLRQMELSGKDIPKLITIRLD